MQHGKQEPNEIDDGEKKVKNEEDREEKEK